MKCEFCNNEATQYFVSGFGSTPVPICENHKYSDVSYEIGSPYPLSESPFPMSEEDKVIRNNSLHDISELEKMLKK